MNETDCIGCLWWECFACDGAEEYCSKFIGVQNPVYRPLRKAYEEDVELALQPVYEKWKQILSERD